MGNDSLDKTSKDSSTEQSKEKDNTIGTKNRRLQDGISSKNPTRKLNLDRRLKNNERRTNYDYSFSGQPRRYTIDRRLTNKDRRSNESYEKQG